MHDGTTPLVLAARLAIEGMVEILINADADINAADDHGKKLFLINLMMWNILLILIIYWNLKFD